MHATIILMRLPMCSIVNTTHYKYKDTHYATFMIIKIAG